MLRVSDSNHLSDEKSLRAKIVQHEVTFCPRAHTRIASAQFVEVNTNISTGKSTLQKL
jgi:hypothetical protein